MFDHVRGAVDRLRTAGVKLTGGLQSHEIDRIEETLGFNFGTEHRAFLAAALPIGEAAWVDWRDARLDDLRHRLAWPVDGVLFDVNNNGFWAASWGPKPTNQAAAEAVAREHLTSVPTLIPLYGHRYLPADPAPVPSPVFSVYQTDVIFYGDNLLDYVANEFKVPPLHPAGPEGRHYVPFWSDLAEGADAAAL